MTWVKLDDQFPDHPKVVGLSDGALACWVRGLCYASRHLTDGHIPRAALRGIGSKRAADELVRAELWLQNDDGFSIHDYADHQRTRKEIEQEREAARARTARSRASRRDRAAASRRDTNVSNGEVRHGHSEVTEPEVEVETDPPLVPRDTPTGAAPDVPAAGAAAEEDRPPTGHTPHGTPHWDGNATPWPPPGDPPDPEAGALVVATLDHIAVARLEQRLAAGDHIRDRRAWLTRTRANAETEHLAAVAAQVADIDPASSDPATIAERIDPALGPLDGGDARAVARLEADQALLADIRNAERTPMPDEVRELRKHLRTPR